ncbi:NADH dehydrogenase [ubiquinone] 1 alpha subcomplex subunit 11 [Panulirus ornatus]|uniref:NADH dehydrogenase [ubiquinone] 1 alpha subcomplex subunit 11 n=1 Tax=Panulirus ornatus TaxID=150431 RepID=UPI003A860D45
MGYTDHPDGQDCFGKVIATSKYGLCLGLVASTYDVMFLTTPQGYLPTLSRYFKSTIPCLAAGATFATVTCASTTIRGKDDKINYFMGGASAGGVFGVAARTFRVGLPVGFLLGVAAVIFKASKDGGWAIVPQQTRMLLGMDSNKYDYSLVKDK